MISQRGFWIGFLGSAAFMAVFVYFFVDFDTIGDVMRDANYAYVAPSLVLYFLAVQARSMRWKFLLMPLMGEPKRAIYPVVVVGYMANNIVPLRIGELLRSYHLSIRESVSAAGAFGTIAVERASDVMGLLFFLAVAWAFLPSTGFFDEFAQEVPGGATVLTIVAVLPFIGVFGMVALVTIVSDRKIVDFCARVSSPLPKGVQAKGLGLLASLLQGLTVVSSPKRLVIVFLYSLPVWALEAAMYYLIALGFDMGSYFDSQIEFIAVLLVFTAAANLAGVIPSSAGGWGPFDYFGAVALTSLAVPDSVAAGFSLTVHVALWVPVTVLGAVMLLMDGSSLRQLIAGLQKDRESSADGM